MKPSKKKFIFVHDDINRGLKIIILLMFNVLVAGSGIEPLTSGL